MANEQDLGSIILEKYKQQLNFNSRLLDLANTALQEINKKEISYESLNYFEGILVVLFPSCIKKFMVIQLLCKKGYADSAGLVLRSMINALIDLYYMRTDPIKLGERYLRYDFVIRKRKLDILDKYPNLFSTPLISSDSGMSKEEILKEYKEFKRLYPKAKLTDWSGLRIDEKAKAAGEGKNSEMMYYLGYKYFSDFEHNNVVSLYNHIENGSDGKFTILCEPNEKGLDLVLKESFLTFVQLFDLFCDSIRLDFNEKIKELSANFEAIFERKK